MLERRFKSTKQLIAQPNKGKAVLNKLDLRQDPSQVNGVTGRHNYLYDNVLCRTQNEIDRDNIVADGGFGRL
jgi:hypothetical protein